MHLATQKQTTSAAAFIAVACAVAAWWLARPYLGVEHDALYYAAEAFRRSGIEKLSQDIFFGPGTQGGYSVFPAIYGVFTRWIGVETAALWLTGLSHLLWPIALAYLSYAAIGIGRWPLGTALALVMPVYYDSHHRLSYGEPFATPRPWAEAISMVAIATACQRNYPLSIILALLAFAVHPIMGLPAVLVVVLLLPSVWRASILSLLVIGIAMLAACGVDPAARLLQTYDPQWFALVANRNPLVLFAAWNIDALCRAIMSVVLLIGVSTFTQPGTAAHRFAWATAWASMLLLSTWMVGTLYENQLITQLQLYRVIWLAQLSALILIVTILPSPGNEWRPTDKIWMALLGAALLSPGWLCLPLTLTALLAKKWTLHKTEWANERMVRLIVIASVSLFMGLAALHLLAIESQIISNRETHQDQHPYIRALASEPVLVALLGLGFIYFYTKLPNLQRSWFLAGCLCIPLSAAVFWGNRALNKTAKSHYNELAEWGKQLPDSDGPIFWDAGVANTWLGLGRPFYASTAQGAQMLFSRTLAVELDRRLTALRQAGFSTGISLSGEFQVPENPAQTTPDVRAICSDKELSLVLLSQYIEHLPSRTLTLSNRNVTVYDCTSLR